MSKETPEEKKLRDALKSKAVEVPATPSKNKLDKILKKANDKKGK